MESFSAADIGYFQLALAYLALFVPLLLFDFFRTGLFRPTLLAAIRMTVQLALVGLYLELIFELNKLWLNLLWVSVMVFAASVTIVNRTDLYFKRHLLAVFLALFSATSLTVFYFLFIVIRPEQLFDAWYFIPVAGMILGNGLNGSIIAVRAYRLSRAEKRNLYQFYLMCGATEREADFSFIQDALRQAFSPQIASMANMGLISLPGMMTGQILGGSNPAVAIKYQIIIMIAILTATSLSVIFSLLLIRFAERK